MYQFSRFPAEIASYKGRNFFIIWVSFLIFLLLLDLLAVSDSSSVPRTGVRRGELWSRLAFNISEAPIQLLCELERMARGITLFWDYINS